MLGACFALHLIHQSHARTHRGESSDFVASFDFIQYFLNELVSVFFCMHACMYVCRASGAPSKMHCIATLVLFATHLNGPLPHAHACPLITF